MKANITSLLLAVATIAVGCGQSGNKITAEGVGTLRFGMENPSLKGYEAEFFSVYNDMYDENDVTWEYKDAEGNVAVRYFVDYRIDVHSPDFQTEEGIHAGMTVDEVRKALGDRELQIYSPNDMGGIVIELSDAIGLLIGFDSMGGYEKFQEWWLKGGEITIDDLSPDSPVEAVMVINVL